MAGAVIRISGEFDDAALKKASAALGKFGVHVDGISQKSSSGFSGISTKAVAMGAAIARVGTDIAYALGRQAIGAITSSIDAARDMNETISKVGVIFGAQAGEIEKFANTAATTLGLSKQAAMDAASTFATFGKSAGLAGADLTGFSTQLTGLSSDLASFYNTSPEDAITAIGAALRGENEPIRKYGILLDDATLRQQALELGIVSTTKNALTPSQKVLAAQAAILKQTGDASGDFARTSGGLANQQRILAAQVDNVKTVFGQAFLPVVLKVTTAFTSKLIPAITTAAEWVKENLGPALENITNKIGGLFSGVGSGASILTTFTGYLKAIGAGFTSTILPALERLMPQFQAFFGVIKNNVLPAIQEFIGFIAKDVVPVAAKLVAAIIDIVGILLKHLTPVVKTVADVFRESIIPAVKQLWEKIKPLIDVVIDLGKNLATIAGTIISKVAPVVLKIAGFLIRNLAPAFGVVIDIIKVVVTIIGKVVGVLAHLGDAFNAVKDVGLKAWNLLMAGIEFVINKVIGFFNGLIRAWNLVPFHDDVAEIADVTLPRVATAADKATAAMAGFGRESGTASQALAGLAGMTRTTSEQKEAFTKLVKSSTAATKVDTEATKTNATTATKSADEKIKATNKLVAAEAAAAAKRRKAIQEAAQASIDSAKDLFDGVKSAVMDSFNKVVESAKSRVETLGNALADLKKSAVEFSKSFVDGFRSFASVAGYVIQKVDLEAFQSGITKSSEDVASALGDQSKATVELANAQRALQVAQMEVNEAGNDAKLTESDRLRLADKIIDAQNKVNDANATLAKSTDQVTRARQSQVDAEKALVKAQEDSRVTAAKVLTDFKARITQTLTFFKQVSDLRNLGLNQTSLQDIIAAGADTGSQIATAVLQGGSAAVGEINSLQSQFEMEASKLGDLLATDRFGAQIATAAEILDKAEADLTLAQARQKVFADLFDSIEAKFAKILGSKTEALDALKKSLEAALTGQESAMGTLIDAISTISNNAIQAAKDALAAATSKGQAAGIIPKPIGDNSFLTTVVPRGATRVPELSSTSTFRPAFMDTVAPYGGGGSKTNTLTLAPGAIQVDAKNADADQVGIIIDRKLRQLVREMDAR